MITKQEIKKLYKIDTIKQKAKEINSSDLQEEKKNELLFLLNEKLNEVKEYQIKKDEKTKEYKKEWWEKNAKKKYKRITSKYSEEDYELIEMLSKKLKRKRSEIVSIATMKALKEENTYITPKENIEDKKSLVKETLISINRIGTNI